MTSTGRHDATGTAQRTRWGSAEPMVARPARQAHAATSRRADQRSERVSSADTIAPATKPSCTEIVSHAAPAVSSLHTLESAGVTADAENHGAMAASCDAASTASTRRAFTDRSGGPETPKEGRTGRGGARPAP